MVYNMGQHDIPLVLVSHPVNDGKYHVIKFVRHGENASLQVDWEKHSQEPLGRCYLVSLFYLFDLRKALDLVSHQWYIYNISCLAESCICEDVYIIMPDKFDIQSNAYYKLLYLSLKSLVVVCFNVVVLILHFFCILCIHVEEILYHMINNL